MGSREHGPPGSPPAPAPAPDCGPSILVKPRERPAAGGLRARDVWRGRRRPAARGSFHGRKEAKRQSLTTYCQYCCCGRWRCAPGTFLGHSLTGQSSRESRWSRSQFRRTELKLLSHSSVTCMTCPWRRRTPPCMMHLSDARNRAILPDDAR